jgi:hypothetical protein
VDRTDESKTECRASDVSAGNQLAAEQASRSCECQPSWPIARQAETPTTDLLAREPSFDNSALFCVNRTGRRDAAVTFD